MPFLCMCSYIFCVWLAMDKFLNIRAFPAQAMHLALVGLCAAPAFAYDLACRRVSRFAPAPIPNATRCARETTVARFALCVCFCRRAKSYKVRNSYGFVTEFALQTRGQNWKRMQNQHLVNKKFRHSPRLSSLEENLQQLAYLLC